MDIINYEYARGIDKKLTEKLNIVDTTLNNIYTKFEMDENKVNTLESNVLKVNNTTAYTPTSPYEPATKGYVDAMASGSEDNVAITKTFRAVANDDQTEFFYTEPAKQKDRIVIGDIANDTTYSFVIGEDTVSFTSDSDATSDEVRDGIQSAADALDGYTATVDGDDVLIENDTINVAFEITGQTGLTSSTIVLPTDGIKYVPGSITIAVEGIIKDNTEYTAEDGNKIVFNDGLSEDEVVELIAYGGADVYNKSQVNTFINSKYSKSEVNALIASVVPYNLVDTKTANYTAVAKDFIPCNTTDGASL